MNEKSDKLWSIFTRLAEQKNNNSSTVFKLAEKSGYSEKEVMSILETLSQESIVKIPPSWAFGHNVSLLKHRFIAEPEPETPEIESPPPTPVEDEDEEFNNILKRMAERDKQKESKSKKAFNEDQLKEDEKRRYKSAQAHARRLIKRYNLISETKFRECQVCGKPEAEIYIPDLNYPQLVNILCHSHLLQERNDPKGIPTISIRLETEKKRKKSKRFDKNRSPEYSKDRANTRKLRFYKRFKHLMPELHCSHCGKSEEETNVQLILQDISRPLVVTPLCRSCQQELRYHSHQPLQRRTDLKQIDLAELAGIFFPSDLMYFRYQILKEFRSVNKGVLSCYSCDVELKDSELYVNKTNDGLYYLTCPDCMEAAKEEMELGIYVHPPKRINLNYLDL